MYLFEADTCPHDLRVQTEAVETPQFTAGENTVFPATTVEASADSWSPESLFFCFSHFSVFSPYNTTLASLEYKTSLFTAEFCHHSSALVSALAGKPLECFFWQSLFWQHKPGPPVISLPWLPFAAHLEPD